MIRNSQRKDSATPVRREAARENFDTTACAQALQTSFGYFNEMKNIITLPTVLACTLNPKFMQVNLNRPVFMGFRTYCKRISSISSPFLQLRF
jgi:hypothetical protein